ncbi:MAG: hypothetical protein JRF59_13405 [Deltaproteobacteria bacterium]|nr:hypothetical protein [Deltaproteobacteria bacterium]MBW1923948.1 hypothetical protein [Deltaproteobacteria bacterium]MBW1950891.1 hypothetical protein [Deltaproteobacteria bacterium]MBW2009066.1 hypothetical protein [Deltaproteobacteria bacterium]MBW2103351.1 hypothetical protein [Deltaproteobacteria bacterium]
MKGYRQQREEFISLMGEADYKRLMERYNRASDAERKKIEQFLNDLLEKGRKEDPAGGVSGETLQLSREEMEKIQEELKKKGPWKGE